ncbi:MAG TPA: queuosine precursor transporter [Ferruginibacter sp.]|nr:queuosine precursor transporter [Ferruginibacter sp.]HRE64529.1 queuosine precursor transporter [Ferruginibacter sp.]
MVKEILGSKATKLFIVLAGFFITNAIIAEVIGVKIFSLEDTVGLQRANIPLFGGTFSFHLTAGVLLWPVVFVMTDIINEYYGPKGVRFLSFLAIGLIAFSFLAYNAAIVLKPSEYFSIGNGIEQPDNAFRGIFGQGLWIIIGSITAFLLGQLLDVMIFHRIKKATGEKAIWLRATGSTLVSQLIDSFVVLFIAFYIGKRIQSGQGDPWSLQQILITGTGNYIYKFFIALLMTPVIYWVHAIIEKYLGKEQATALKKEAMQAKAE